MKILVMIGGAVMAIFGAFQFGQSGPAPFEYSSATYEERKAFLSNEANAIAKTVSRSLVSPSGVGPSFRLTGLDVNPDDREITVEFSMSSSGRPDHTAFRKLAKNMKAAECPRFAKSRLAANEVELDYVFLDKFGSRIKKVSISNRDCEDALGA